MPTVENLNELVKVAHDLEEKTGVVFRYISGGNSTSYTLILDGNLPNGINQLRIGDTFYSDEICHGEHILMI
jgi:predicted amino acid racemase